MFYQLPPVGNPVHYIKEVQPRSALQSFFAPYQAEYYNSGTAALAAAIIAAARIKEVRQPEVIIPAYACPDLVSAAIFAGVKPVLVDMEPEKPWMDLERLLTSINSSTIAIVAASLFGIPERIELLRQISVQVDAVIIEDSAQAFPGSDEKNLWKGDMVVLSFGRGKPVNLLGGGAVLFRQAVVGGLLPKPTDDPGNGRMSRLLFHFKRLVFNRMITPRLYWLPQSLPFLYLGETRYHPLTGIGVMDTTRRALLLANIAAYQESGVDTQTTLRAMLEEMDTNDAGLIDLAQACRVSTQRRLLRYPLLVNESIRDRLHQQLYRLGAGSSLMYPAALPDIAGLETLLAGQGPFPAAEAFAASILTLPTHRKVRLEDIANIRQVLCSCQGR